MAAPKARRNTTIIAALLYLISIPFLILTLIGNTHDRPVLRDTYFFKLDVAQIIPIAVANSGLLNSVARSLGLHDFYQVGVWNFCEGYNDVGITYCSPPRTFYWFNPVQILVSELLAGAKIALPSEVLTILRLLEIGSKVMYAFFMAGTVINLVLLLGTPLVMRTRWFSLFLSLLGGLSGLVLTVAAIIATVISVAAKIALTAQDQLNIKANIGVKMFAFMWIGALATDFAFLLHAAMGCCCKPVRGGSGKSPNEPSPEGSAKKPMTHLNLPSFIRRRKGASPAS
ncbi:integral membrane protein [Metarhizium anisopliae]|uniref:SUR7 family protein n=2 Tax=Metarhizium TaxID=5529 RepID=A0A0D9PET5_METAN